MAQTLTAQIRRHLLDLDLDVDLTSHPVTVLFGPSGAGKTTLLRCLAGLDRPDPGSRIHLGTDIWDGPGIHVPARRRQIGYLFQDHVLFPHLGVADNVGYGLHRLARSIRPARIVAALTAAGAAHLHDRPTRGLSGGEAQRVALARAIAPLPRLLLLDEPLSALDTPTRARLRTDLRRMLLSCAIPTIVVTHDRTEALALADHIAVIVAGRLHHSGTIDDVFNRPATPETAAAVGVETVTTGQITAHHDGLTHIDIDGHTLHAAHAPDLAIGDHVLACIRAEDVALQLSAPDGASSPRNHLRARIAAIHPDGPLLRVQLDAGFPLTAYITRPTREQLDLHPGTAVTAAIKAPAIHLIAHPAAPTHC